MTRTFLPRAVCTVALLAAAPAFAQSTHTPPAAGSTGSHSNMTNQAPDMMSPSDEEGSGGSSSAMKQHAGRHDGMMQGKGDMSADMSADQLNEQSLQAARQGQAFNGSASGTMPMHDNAGSMNDMSGGSMKGSAPPGGSPAR